MSQPPDGEPGADGARTPGADGARTPGADGEVRALLESESVGLLSTTSVHRPGYPYGSLTPFALSSRGNPLLLLSGLAAHTKNLLADPRACLFLGDRSAAEDPLAGARVSLLGRAAHVTTVDEPDARDRYLARHPKAASYFELRDFRLWELTVEEARLISGFGSMRWLPFGQGA